MDVELGYVKLLCKYNHIAARKDSGYYALWESSYRKFWGFEAYWKYILKRIF